MASNRDHLTERLLAQFGEFITPTPAEDSTVSIQIRDMANPESRKEIRERLEDVCEAYRLVWADAGATEEQRQQRGQAFDAKLGAFYHALTGYDLKADSKPADKPE